MIVVQQKVSDLIQQVGELNGEFVSHEKRHEQNDRERISGRRWIIGTGIAGVASMSAMIALLVDVAQHVH